MLTEQELERIYQVIKSSNLFDVNFYHKSYSDVVGDAIWHYIEYGAKELKNPSSFFNTEYYLNTYTDVEQAGVNPLFHYVLHGVRERRNPNSYFNTSYYLENNSDVKESGVNPLLHYMRFGHREKRLVKKDEGLGEDVNKKRISQPRFIIKDNELSNYDWEKYSEFNSDLARNKIDPIEHYSNRGYFEGRRSVYKRDYLEILNGKQKVSVYEYHNYKCNRERARTVVYTFNYSKDTQLKNPQNISKDIDYIYFGVPIQSEELTVWVYQDSGFFIESLSLMQTFHCLNSNILFPEYENTVWVSSFNYLSSLTYANIDKFIGDKKTQVFFLGERQFLDKRVSLDINNDGVFSSFSSHNPDFFEVMKLNCLILNNKNSLDLNYFSEWWRVVIKYQLYNCLPFSLVDSFNAQYYPEQLRLESDLFDSDTYLDYTQEYQLSIIGNYNLKKDNLLGDASVSIVIPIFNALEDVKLCIESIESSTFDNYRVILADDGSHQEVQSWLIAYAEKNKKFDVLIAEENRGYTLNVNNAIRNLSSDYIILLNSDTQVYGRWIEELLLPFILDSSVGISGPLSNAAGWQTVPYLRGDNSLPDHLNLQKVNEYLQGDAYSKSYAISDIVNGFCFCFSQEVLQTIGLFNGTEFPMGYGEEDDFCIRSRCSGFKNVIVTSAYVHHSKSKSFGHEKRIKLATAGRIILDNKYGKEGYKLLTDSIGKNAIVNAKREKLKELFKPFKTEKTIIGEDIILVPNEELIYPKTKDFNGKICVHLHLHYIDMMDYFVFYLNNIPFKFDLYITTGQSTSNSSLRHKFSFIKNVDNIEVELFENRGRDIFPFIKVLSRIFNSYEYYLHIHSKKSVHNALGSKWLSTLMSNLLYSPEYVTNLLSLMDSNQIGLMFPPVIEDLYPNYKWGKNKPLAKAVLQRLDVDLELDDIGTISFPAGNMHWGRTYALKKLFTAGFTVEDFPEEPIPVDGTLAHTIERVFPLIVEDAGFTSLVVKASHSKVFEKEKEMFSHKLLSVESIYSNILEKVYQKEPLALIRFYDGEGAFYKAESWSESFIQERMTYYFGAESYSNEDVNFIKNLILSALDAADIVGIPNLDIVDNMLSFTQRFADSNIEKLPSIARRYNGSIDCNSAWRILSSFELVVHALSTDKIGYCTKDIHYDLVLSGYLYRLLDKVSQISIITSQPVRSYLEQLFDLDVTEYSIPSRSIDSDSTSTTSHYSTRFHQLQEELASKDLRGQLFLIGAGPLGKVYCESVKKQGGVAIDIGAVFDSWINFRTRPEHATKEVGFNNNLLLTSRNIIDLTSGEVEPKNQVLISDLPSVKTNRLLTNLF